jgi:hypothetical protein
VDDEDFSEEEDQDPLTTDKSEHMRGSPSEDDGKLSPTCVHDHLLNFLAPESTAGREVDESPSVHDEIPVLWTFKFIINVQLTLFLFLTLSWLSDRVG